jgi:hypothetical protein
LEEEERSAAGGGAFYSLFWVGGRMERRAAHRRDTRDGEEIEEELGRIGGVRLEGKETSEKCEGKKNRGFSRWENDETAASGTTKRASTISRTSY